MLNTKPRGIKNISILVVMCWSGGGTLGLPAIYHVVATSSLFRGVLPRTWCERPFSRKWRRRLMEMKRKFYTVVEEKKGSVFRN